MIKQQILHRSEISILDSSDYFKDSWDRKVIDYRKTELSRFTQDLFELNKHDIKALDVFARILHMGSEYLAIMSVKMSNGDIIEARYSKISNLIKINEKWDRFGKLKISINGKEIQDFLGCDPEKLINFDFIRSFYFDLWLPSVQPI